jgi:steroid 5-alpha reductase family enzyme
MRTVRINPPVFRLRIKSMLIIFCALGVSLAMSFAWVVRMRTGQSGWIDTIWSLATGLGALAFLAPQEGRSLFAGALVALWSLRLGGHIALRTHGAGDDPRYAALAREWGADFPRRLFIFLQIQAAASLPLIIAVGVAGHAPRPFPDWADGLALVIALSGLIIEGVADWQLRRFRRQAPPHSLCETGLWAYTRHPNYFGEFLFWCAWPLMAFGDWRALAALIAPALIYWLLDHVSGVPLLEAHMRASRGVVFDDYAARVPRFFPGRARQKSNDD